MGSAKGLIQAQTPICGQSVLLLLHRQTVAELLAHAPTGSTQQMRVYKLQHFCLQPLIITVPNRDCFAGR